MIFRQLFDRSPAPTPICWPAGRGGEALIIDPVLEKVDRYLQLSRELDLRLVKAVDTHLHADHITGLGALRDRTHCITVMGEQSQVDVVSMRHRRRRQADASRASSSTCSTRPATPTIPTAFVLADRVFTGDTLLIRGTGRTDFQNGDRARAIRQPVQQVAEAAGRDAGVSGARLQGRHGQHHRRGEALQSAAAGRNRPTNMSTLMAALNLPNPKMMDVAVPANMRQGLACRRRSRAAAGRVGAAEAHRAGRPSRHRAGRLAGEGASASGTARSRAALHAPYPDAAGKYRAGGMLHELVTATGKQLLFYCAFGERSAMAVQAAQDAGLTSARHIEGGMDAWKKAAE